MQDMKREIGAGYEVIVVGGSFAGLSAAMQLARARRKILVLDAGKPRNRFAVASHGFLGQDGRAPGEIIAIARAQLAAYPTVHFQTGEAVDAAQDDDGFAVMYNDGNEARAKRLVLATGLVDHLPDVPGMREVWGVGVNMCPYCHGYEVAGRRLAVYGVGPEYIHVASLLRDWSDHVTLLTNGDDWLTPDTREFLEMRGVGLDETPVARLIATGKELRAVEFNDGRTVPYDTMFTGTRTTFASPLAERLGCEIEVGRTGPMIKTSERKETTVPGVFAAGDAANPIHSATLASADGVMAGVFSHQSMLPVIPQPSVTE